MLIVNLKTLLLNLLSGFYLNPKIHLKLIDILTLIEPMYRPLVTPLMKFKSKRVTLDILLILIQLNFHFILLK
ncbi:hypothetical protein COB52_03190 [Candidatus Kaiserbacteria bacterium]|nr:MAG: hypothetical protein COB52_03190 [Candidatus Kaiserbacteria bacterium]